MMRLLVMWLALSGIALGQVTVKGGVTISGATGLSTSPILCGPPNYLCSSISTATVQTPNTPYFTSGSTYNSYAYDTSLNLSGVDPILLASDTSMLDGHSPASTPSQGDNDQIFDCTGSTASVACQNSTTYFLEAYFGGGPFVAALQIDPVTKLPKVVGPFPPHTSGIYHPTGAGAALEFSRKIPATGYLEAAVGAGGDPTVSKVVYSWDGIQGHYPTFVQTTVVDAGVSCPIPNGTSYGEGWSGPVSSADDDLFTWSSSNVTGVGLGVATATVANGSTSVTISGTTLRADGSYTNAVIKLGNPLVAYTIASNTASTVTLTSAYSGSGCASGCQMSIPSGQGTGIYVIAYRVSTSSCSVWNTYTGAITGNGSFPSGTIDTGCHNMYLHDGFLTGDGVYGHWSGASTGINCGTGVQFWQTGTLHGVSCTAAVTNGSNGLCGGHQGMGVSRIIYARNSGFFNVDPATTPASGTPVAPYATVDPGCDQHFSWRNSSDDTQSIIGSTTTNNYSTSGSGSTYTQPYMNEIFATSLGAVTRRFAHSQSLGPGNICGAGQVGPFDNLFAAQYAIGSVSQDGKLFSYSSSDLGGFGTDVDGNTGARIHVIRLD